METAGFQIPPPPPFHPFARDMFLFFGELIRFPSQLTLHVINSIVAIFLSIRYISHRWKGDATGTTLTNTDQAHADNPLDITLSEHYPPWLDHRIEMSALLLQIIMIQSLAWLKEIMARMGGPGVGQTMVSGNEYWGGYAGVVAANDGNTGQAGGQGALLQLVWLTATAASVNRWYRR